MMRFASMACALLLLVSSGAARAGEASPNPYLNAGMRLWADLEYESALEQLKKAASFAGNTPAEDIQIALYRGLIRFELGDPTGAETDFKTALAFDPQVRLPGKVSPKVAAAFEKARVDILKARPPKPPKPPDKVVTVTDVPKAIDQPKTIIASNPEGPVGPDLTTGKKVETKTSPLPYILLGSGAALAIGGVIFGVQSSKSVDAAKVPGFQSDASSKMDSARSQALAANILYGAAGVAVAAGIITLFAGGTSAEAPPAPAH